MGKGNAYICKEIFNSVCILANGNVVCSCRDLLPLNILGNLKRNRISDIFLNPLNILGNLKQNHISDIFKNAKYNKLRELILSSEPNSYCPAIKEDCCFKGASCHDIDLNIYPKIEVLQLETISYCNLKCPLCPASQWASSNRARLGILQWT
jgi:hypothetical protein